MIKCSLINFNHLIVLKLVFFIFNKSLDIYLFKINPYGPKTYMVQLVHKPYKYTHMSMHVRSDRKSTSQRYGPYAFDPNAHMIGNMYKHVLIMIL